MPRGIFHLDVASTSTGRHSLRWVTSSSDRFRSSRRIFLEHPDAGRHLGFSFFSRLVNRFMFSVINTTNVIMLTYLTPTLCLELAYESI